MKTEGVAGGVERYLVGRAEAGVRGIYAIDLVVYPLLYQKLKGYAVGIATTRGRAVALGDFALIAAVDIDLDITIKVGIGPKEDLAIDARGIVGDLNTSRAYFVDLVLCLDGQQKEKA